MKKPEERSGRQVEEDANMKPSKVVQQQRQIQLGICTSAKTEQEKRSEGPAASSLVYTRRPFEESAVGGHLFDQDGLVLPKKVLPQPGGGLGGCIKQQPIMRDLNRELKFNQVRGMKVLEQKSELKRAMEKLEESKRKRELEAERLSRRTSLELRLEERAERIAKTAAGESPLERPSSASSCASTGGEKAASAAAAAGTCKPQAASLGLKSAVNR